jgi:flagellar motor component MotA
MNDVARRRVLAKYEGYGLLGGFVAGLIVGVLLSGQHFKEWSALELFLVVGGGAAAGALGGFLAVTIGAVVAGLGDGGSRGGD